MDTPILGLRREHLRRLQNADGGWGYFAGKQSWFEPTAYATLALYGDKESAGAVAGAWRLLRSWQLADGGWKPAAHIENSTWVTALGVTLCTVLEEYGRPLDGGLRWLLRTTGAESSLSFRVREMAGLADLGRSTKFRGWPWGGGAASWVEPTAHSLVALKKAAVRRPGGEIRTRIDEGERLLTTVRARDGGWNYGSPSVLGIELPSYPETTALALLGLQERTPAGALERLRRLEGGAPSRLADAWASISMSAVGEVSGCRPPRAAPADLMIAALEALAAPGGNAGLFRTHPAKAERTT
jgi:hypothetical protein